MRRILVAHITILTLLVQSVALAVPCSNPFGTTQANFELVAPLSCKSVTSPVVYKIAAANSTASDNAPRLSPGCAGDSPFFDLYMGSQVITYTDGLSDAMDETVRVIRACDGERIFLVNRDPALIDTPQGPVNTSLQVYAEDSARTLLGYVLVSEDNADGLTFRALDGHIAASATKSLSQDGKHCQATWQVSNFDNTQSTATIITYLLALKDNQDLSCPGTDAHKCKGESALEVIGHGTLGAVIGAALTATGFVLYMKGYHNGLFYKQIK